MFWQTSWKTGLDRLPYCGTFVIDYILGFSRTCFGKGCPRSFLVFPEIIPLSPPNSIPSRNSKPRNRPSFRQILLHLDIASADVLSTPQETYFKSQVCYGWKRNTSTPALWGGGEGPRPHLDQSYAYSPLAPGLWQGSTCIGFLQV